MKKLFIISFYLLFLICILSLCSCRGSGTRSRKITGKKYVVKGIVQKGPFVIGSSVIIQELDDFLKPTGISYQTLITDDFGTFKINSNIKSRYVEIFTLGHYYDEVSGELSDSTLSLKAIADLEDGTEINVNLLTHLSIDRIKFLMSSGFNYSASKAFVEREVLSIFNIPNTNIDGFEKMDISKTGTSNAVLLAVSSILQADNSPTQLNELLSKINADIKLDGSLDGEIEITEIASNSETVNLINVKNNLKDRYISLGLKEVNIPDPVPFVDSDFDGLLNLDDDDILTTATFSEVFAYWNFSDQQVVTSTLSIDGLSASGHIYLELDKNMNIGKNCAKIFKNGSDVGISSYLSNGDEVVISANLQLCNDGDDLIDHLGDSITINATWGKYTSGQYEPITLTYTASSPTVGASTSIITGNGPYASINTNIYFAHPIQVDHDMDAVYVITPWSPSYAGGNIEELCIYSDDAETAPKTSLGCSSLFDNKNLPTSLDITEGGTYNIIGNPATFFFEEAISLTTGTNYWIVAQLNDKSDFFTDRALNSEISTPFAKKLAGDDGLVWDTDWKDSDAEFPATMALPFAILE